MTLCTTAEKFQILFIVVTVHIWVTSLATILRDNTTGLSHGFMSLLGCIRHVLQGKMFMCTFTPNWMKLTCLKRKKKFGDRWFNAVDRFHLFLHFKPSLITLNWTFVHILPFATARIYKVMTESCPLTSPPNIPPHNLTQDKCFLPSFMVMSR